MLVIADPKLVAMLQDEISNLIAGQGLLVHLFNNNYTPIPGSVIGNYTDAVFSGYAPQTLTPVGPTYLVSTGIAVQNFVPCVFLQSGGIVTDNIHGYFVTDSTNTILWWG